MARDYVQEKAIRNALATLALNPRNRAWLMDNDPKALAQADAAMSFDPELAPARKRAAEMSERIRRARLASTETLTMVSTGSKER